MPTYSAPADPTPGACGVSTASIIRIGAPTRSESFTMPGLLTRGCAVLLLAIGMGALAAAEPVVPPAVQAELERLDADWSAPFPDQSPYRLQAVVATLDLSLPALAPVRDAYGSGDLPACERALLAYFRSKYAADAPRAAKAVSDGDRTIADDAVRHVFRGNGTTHPPVFRGAVIDWRTPAVVDGKTIHDAEWLAQYHRLTWWEPLARAYQATRDEAYFREWRYELVSYAEANLPIPPRSPGFIARGMEVGRRCTAITRTLPVFIHSPGFDVKALLYALQSVHLQVEHMRTSYAGKMNHRLANLSDVFTLGIAFPEFTKAKEWRDEAASLLPKVMFADIYDDGMNKEMVFSYHGMYLGLFAQAYRLFHANGYGERITPEFHRRLVRMAEMYAYAVFPDFTLPQFGDGWKGAGGAKRLLVDELPSAKADLPFGEFFASQGRKGVPPPKTSIAFPTSGFYFFRSSWTPGAVFMPVKCTEAGEWHNQHDNGTFELYAKGRNFMIDSGCYIYGSSAQEERDLREWFRSTRVHQTLTLDDANAERKPRFVLWAESPGVKALVIENQGRPDLLHRRTILFVDDGWFLVHDEAIGAAAGEVAIHFQLVPCEVAQRDDVVETRFASGPNLKVQSFPLAQAPRYQAEEGWISYAILKRLERPAWKWSLAKTGAQPQVGFLTALVPLDAGAHAELADAGVQAGAEGTVYTVTRDGVRYEVTLRTAKNEVELRKR